MGTCLDRERGDEAQLSTGDEISTWLGFLEWIQR